LSLEQNKALVRRVLEEVWSQGNLAAIDELYAADFVSHQPGDAAGPRGARGLEALKTFVREFREAFPDFHDVVDDQVAEGDRVVTRFTSAGTHRGALMGIAPTNREVRWSGVAIDRIVDGRIAENWVSWDMLGMLRQLGAVSWPG